MAKQTPESKYSPEVEARRADYEKLVECIIHMAELEACRQPSLLDIEGPDTEINKPHLANAINHHLYALHMHIDWYDPATIRRFYVEMRLWGDQRIADYGERRDAAGLLRLVTESEVVN